MQRSHGIWLIFLAVALLALPGCKKETAECGNGSMEGGEVCDGSDFGGDNCQLHGYRSGLLTCTSTCDNVLMTRCVGGCGNGMKDEGEECDQSDFGGGNCQINGFDYGSLGCNGDCTMDLSGCVNAVCGNADVEEVEECDFDAAGLPITEGEDCKGLGFNAGDLACFARGTENECTLDTSGCQIWECGNGVVDPGEDCDFDTENNPILEDETCVTNGYDYGELGCVPKDATDIGRRCRFDVSQCLDYVCGNGEVEGAEECEVGVTITATCADEGFQSGTMACKTDDSCRFDLSGCVDGCGNEVKEGTEQCDGADIGTDTCATVLGDTFSGELRCKTDCTYDITNCVEA